MIAQVKITSGYDIEFLMGEEYLRYIFMTLFETGSMPWFINSENLDENKNVISIDTVLLHPPRVLSRKRLYEVPPEFEGHEHPFLDIVDTVYSWRDDELKVTYIKDHAAGANIKVSVYPTVITNSDDVNKRKVKISNVVPIELFVKTEIIHNAPDSNGFIGNIRLKIELVDVGGYLIEEMLKIKAKDKNGNMVNVYTKKDILGKLKPEIDRDFPFAVNGEGNLQKIAMKFFVDEVDSPNALGIYINLGLKDGPDRLTFSVIEAI